MLTLCAKVFISHDIYDAPDWILVRTHCRSNHQIVKRKFLCTASNAVSRGCHGGPANVKRAPPRVSEVGNANTATDNNSSLEVGETHARFDWRISLLP